MSITRRSLENGAASPTENHLASVGMKAFLALAKAWRLTDAEARSLLGNPPVAVLRRWEHGQTSDLPQDVLSRISFLLGIFKALNLLFPNPEQADSWLRRPNTAPLFSGSTALDRMLVGSMEDLRAVRDYLDVEANGLS